VEKIDSYYGKLHILKDVSLELHEGEIVCLIGANGAGKTTLLRTISGFVVPPTGKILYRGQAINGMTYSQIVKLGICQVPEGRQLFPTMRTLDNLKLGAYLRQDRNAIDKDLEEIYTLFPVLKMRQNQLAGTLSGGEQQMVAIGRGLMAKPKLLLLDEPSFGLSPILVQTIIETFRKINAQGVTILLTEQNAVEALKLANRGYVMEVGQIVMTGKGEELLKNENVRKTYLGM
jgi:branched-chain amino acid transport system ATP-binding protein